jgi:hypothetical protein
VVIDGEDAHVCQASLNSRRAADVARALHG